jgi:hypothetical protein
MWRGPGVEEKMGATQKNILMGLLVVSNHAHDEGLLKKTIRSATKKGWDDIWGKKLNEEILCKC